MSTFKLVKEVYEIPADEVIAALGIEPYQVENGLDSISLDFDGDGPVVMIVFTRNDREVQQ